VRMSSLSNTTSVKQNVSGWLKKKSSKKIVGFAKLWQKFFFILDREDQSLKYWKSSDTTRPPVGDIHLSFVKTVSMVDKGKADAEKRFVLNFRGSHVRAFDLKADSIADLNMWILSIRSVQTSVEDKREVASDGKFWKPKLPKKQSNGLQSEVRTDISHVTCCCMTLLTDRVSRRPARQSRWRTQPILPRRRRK